MEIVKNKIDKGLPSSATTRATMKGFGSKHCYVPEWPSKSPDKSA